jgi:glycosyltransferase involved in cell wall biosynthesis
MIPLKLTVIVCVLNEEKRIRDCLDTIYQNNPAEVILVDGGSGDKTVEIAKTFSHIRIIESKNSNLTIDRQKGIDAATNELIAMIDADHRLHSNDLKSLIQDMEEFELDIVQSGLVSYANHGFWDAAEESAWELTHNLPGRRAMIGTAPAIFKKRVFDYVRFDGQITTTIDDTDFFYRLSRFPEFHFGIGRTKIRQYHFSDFRTYTKKFQWYGKGDGEFCHKHLNRAPAMIFHLLIRYPLLYPAKAILKGRFKAVPFFILQGIMRFTGLVKYFAKSI